jgi:osmotically-inducible protein OsmY
MAYRDYELDREYNGNRGNWRGRGDFDRDPWYGGYGAGGSGEPDRGWNRASYGGYPGYGGYGYGGYTGYGYGGYGGYGGGYRDEPREWRGGGAGLGYESGASRSRGGTQSQGAWGQQSFAGRGPRNYQRSDDRIEEDVNESLTRHPGFDASDVEVKVQNGEVTLTGTVDSRYDKRMAEDAAESCSGVRDVHNQLRVSGAGARGSDREVTRAAAQEGRSQSGESRSGSRQTSSRSSR